MKIGKAGKIGGAILAAAVAGSAVMGDSSPAEAPTQSGAAASIVAEASTSQQEADLPLEIEGPELPETPPVSEPETPAPAPEPPQAPDPAPEPPQAPQPAPEPQPPEPAEPEPAAPPPAAPVVPEPEPDPTPAVATQDYVLNTNTMKIHFPSCSSVEDIKPDNRSDVNAVRDDLIAKGFSSCGRCHA